MEKSTTSNGSRVSSYFLAALYLGALAVMGFTGVKTAFSHHYIHRAVEGNSAAAADKAITYEPTMPEAHATRAAIAWSNGDLGAAVASFKRAVELSPVNFLLYLRLGHAQLEAGELDAARDSYTKAISLAPDYAKPNKYMGRLLLALGKRDEGFVYLSRAAEQDRTIYPELLQLARKQFPGDPAAMERAVNARSLEARKATSRYLIKYHFMTEGVRALLTGNELDDDEKNEFIKYLIYKKNSQMAHEAWLTKRNSGFGEEREPIFDGGFERITQSDDSGFGWQIDQRVSHVAVAIDSRVFHTGTRSLHVKFAGAVENGRKIVSQLVMLQPNRPYRLTFAFLSPEMVSGGLPVVGVRVGQSPLVEARSEPLTATNSKWKSISIDFRTDSHGTALISLQRSNCSSNPCPVFGELSLDDFSIRELG